VINRHIEYAYDYKRGRDMPVIGKDEPLFGKSMTDADAAALIERGKLVIQSRACIDCHTFMGNGAYYAPDLTKAWLDPAWEAWIAITGADSKEEAMARFLMKPDYYATWQRKMPNLCISRDEAVTFFRRHSAAKRQIDVRLTKKPARTALRAPTAMRGRNHRTAN
jgi:nitric oxide reductase subunit C